MRAVKRVVIVAMRRWHRWISRATDWWQLSNHHRSRWPGVLQRCTEMLR